nr:putative ribonuclease H-like domain-containing protein [Tanacetum cinerariifolium]
MSDNLEFRVLVYDIWHMTGNKAYLADYQEINDGGFVVFGSSKGKITGKENQLSLKVKVIKSDNGTKFKNSDLNQFCELKGIKREFSIPRTPQQNGIAERKNRTLIEAAKTMLVDSLLPIPFWAEAVNTACYVQNRATQVFRFSKTFVGNPLTRLAFTNLLIVLKFICPGLLCHNLDSSIVAFAKREVKSPEGTMSFKLTLYILFSLGKIIVVTLVKEQMSSLHGNLPRLPIRSNIVRLATTSIGTKFPWWTRVRNCILVTKGCYKVSMKGYGGGMKMWNDVLVVSARIGNK